MGDTVRGEPRDDGDPEPTRAGRPGPLGSSVPPAPRHRRYLFSRRVAAVTAATVVLTVVLAAVSVAAIGTPSRTTDGLTARITPALRELYRANRNSARAQSEYEASLETTGVERSKHIADSQRYGNRAAASWAAFKKHALGSPAEQRLIDRYDAATSASQAAGAAAFALADSEDVAARDAAFNVQSDLAQENIEILADIRRRFYVSRLIAGVEETRGELDDARLWVIGIAGLIVVFVVVTGVVLYRTASREERVLAAADAERHREERRASLENQLQRGLEMEPTEASTYEILEAAITLVRPHEPVELLLADSSHAHFHQAFSTDHAGGGPGCPVPSPADCPAAVSGQSRLFLGSTRLDACPYLRNRTAEPRSAACVPVNIAGSSAGVFHTTGPENSVPDPNELAELELVARKAGERIGYLRVLARSEMQARVDVLTGLMNRRSLDDAARELVDEGRPFVVAFADLDHFKDLNDTYGHEIGDRALRLFGRVLREAIRPDDIAGRFGGEEFVVLLPGSGLQDGRAVADRVRERLRSAVAEATVPPFTVSIGIAAWEPPEDFGETVARADDAMLYAKRIGRDRVATSIEVPPAEPSLLPPSVGQAPAP